MASKNSKKKSNEEMDLDEFLDNMFREQDNKRKVAESSSGSDSNADSDSDEKKKPVAKPRQRADLSHMTKEEKKAYHNERRKERLRQKRQKQTPEQKQREKEYQKAYREQRRLPEDSDDEPIKRGPRPKVQARVPDLSKPMSSSEAVRVHEEIQASRAPSPPPPAPPPQEEKKEEEEEEENDSSDIQMSSAENSDDGVEWAHRRRRFAQRLAEHEARKLARNPPPPPPPPPQPEPVAEEVAPQPESSFVREYKPFVPRPPRAPYRRREYAAVEGKVEKFDSGFNPSGFYAEERVYIIADADPDMGETFTVYNNKHYTPKNFGLTDTVFQLGKPVKILNPNERWTKGRPVMFHPWQFDGGVRIAKVFFGSWGLPGSADFHREAKFAEEAMKLKCGPRVWIGNGRLGMVSSYDEDNGVVVDNFLFKVHDGKALRARRAFFKTDSMWPTLMMMWLDRFRGDHPRNVCKQVLKLNKNKIAHNSLSTSHVGVSRPTPGDMENTEDSKEVLLVGYNHATETDGYPDALKLCSMPDSGVVKYVHRYHMYLTLAQAGVIIDPLSAYLLKNTQSSEYPVHEKDQALVDLVSAIIKAEDAPIEEYTK